MAVASPTKFLREILGLKVVRSFIFAAAGIAFVSSPLAAQCNAVATFPLLPGHDLIITVTVNGTNFPMIVDTGASRSSVNEDVVQRLDLPANRGKVSQQYTTAGQILSRNVILRSLKLGEIEFNNMKASVLAVALKPGWTETPKGILGADVLSKFDVDIDVAKHFMRLIQRGLCVKPFDGNFEQIQFETNLTNQVLFPATLNNNPIQVLLDTGATNATLTEDTAQSVDPFEDDAVTARGDGVSAGGRTVSVHIHKFEQLKLGTETFRNIPLNVIDFHSDNVDMLLGLDYLRRRHVFISYSRHVIFVQREEAALLRSSSLSLRSTGLAGLVVRPENVDLEPARDYPVDYKQEIYARVWDQKLTPPNTPGGLVVVRFAFDRFGKLIFEKLVFKSQSDDLNQAAMKMVRMAAPFPLPPELEDDHVTLNVSISFNPQ